MTWSEIRQLAYDSLRSARDNVDDLETASAYALLSIAASLYVLVAAPPIRPVPRDPLDMDTYDPPQSESERYWAERD